MKRLTSRGFHHEIASAPSCHCLLLPQATKGEVTPRVPQVVEGGVVPRVPQASEHVVAPRVVPLVVGYTIGKAMMYLPCVG